MPGNRVLTDDWKDYDNRKVRDRRDRLKFLCEDWEVRYLSSKIKKFYPHLKDVNVKNAIGDCCRATTAPRTRDVFVNCVMKRLDGV